MEALIWNSEGSMEKEPIEGRNLRCSVRRTYPVDTIYNNHTLFLPVLLPGAADVLFQVSALEPPVNAVGRVQLQLYRGLTLRLCNVQVNQDFNFPWLDPQEVLLKVDFDPEDTPPRHATGNLRLRHLKYKGVGGKRNPSAPLAKKTHP